MYELLALLAWVALLAGIFAVVFIYGFAIAADLSRQQKHDNQLEITRARVAVLEESVADIRSELNRKGAAA